MKSPESLSTMFFFMAAAVALACASKPAASDAFWSWNRGASVSLSTHTVQGRLWRSVEVHPRGSLPWLGWQ